MGLKVPAPAPVSLPYSIQSMTSKGGNRWLVSYDAGGQRVFLTNYWSTYFSWLPAPLAPRPTITPNTRTPYTGFQLHCSNCIMYWVALQGLQHYRW